MSIQTRTLDYHHNGTTCQAFLAWDDSLAAPRPAVAIAHTWAGRGQFECDHAERLAKLGYVGCALDVYGDARCGASLEENQALMAPLMADRSLLHGRLLAGLEALRAQAQVDGARVAAMGFCFGGLAALDLARINAPVSGVVSFHGLFKPLDGPAAARIEPRILALHGYDDPMVPPGDMQALAEELTAAAADWQVHAYGGTLHGFTNPAANNPTLGAVYQPRSARRALQAADNFLAELFGASE